MRTPYAQKRVVKITFRPKPDAGRSEVRMFYIRALDEVIKLLHKEVESYLELTGWPIDFDIR